MINISQRTKFYSMIYGEISSSVFVRVGAIIIFVVIFVLFVFSFRYDELNTIKCFTWAIWGVALFRCDDQASQCSPTWTYRGSG